MISKNFRAVASSISLVTRVTNESAYLVALLVYFILIIFKHRQFDSIFCCFLFGECDVQFENKK